jgi:threonyl-tRNA synthetase
MRPPRYLTEFYIPFNDIVRNSSSPEEALIKKISNDGKRKLGYFLGLFYPYKIGQLFYTPLGKLVKNKIEYTLKEVADTFGWYEIETPYFHEKRLFQRSGRYDKFSKTMYHVVEKESFVLHPCGEEFFEELYSLNRLKIKNSKSITFWEFKTHFRNIKRNRPL